MEQAVREPRILLVKSKNDDPEKLAEDLMNDLPGSKVDVRYNGGHARNTADPGEYNALFIDCSDDYEKQGEAYSEYFREENPNAFILGLSAVPARIEGDSLANKRYDSVGSGLFLGRDLSRVKKIMRERGFKV